MTNEQYRRTRGTHRRFRATAEQVRQAWYELFREKIDARRLRDQQRERFGQRRRTKYDEFTLDDD